MNALTSAVSRSRVPVSSAGARIRPEGKLAQSRTWLTGTLWLKHFQTPGRDAYPGRARGCV